MTGIGRAWLRIWPEQETETIKRKYAEYFGI
jgi:hypothetical protein